MDEALLKLPLAVQVSLGSGYLAYLLAGAGIRQHHTPTDAVFRTVAFGLVATGVMIWMPAYPIAGPTIAVLATIAAGALWRWKLAATAAAIVRHLGVSWADDIPTAWLSITAVRTDRRPSQIAVDLENGRMVVCDNTRLFADDPYGPVTFGLDGSLALYVTAERREDGTWIEKDDVRDPVDGPRITYIPAAAIKRVEMRLWTKANGSGELAAAPEQDAEAAAVVSAAAQGQGAEQAGQASVNSATWTGGSA